MDIHCPQCNEPWDTFHLLEDEISNGYDDLTDDDFESFKLSRGMLEPKTQTALESRGWKFAGKNILSFVACSCCKDNLDWMEENLSTHEFQELKTIFASRTTEREIFCELLEHDLDGLLSTIAN